MKTYKKKNGKVIVTEVKIDELKELEYQQLINDTYQDDTQAQDDYLAFRAEKLG